MTGKVAARAVYFKSRHLYDKSSKESVVGSRCWHNRLILFYFVCWYLLISVITGHYPHCNFKLTNVHLSSVYDLVSPCEQQWSWPCKWAKNWAVSTPAPCTRVSILWVCYEVTEIETRSLNPKPFWILVSSKSNLNLSFLLSPPPLRSVWPSEGGSMPKVMGWKNRNESLVSNSGCLHDSRLERIFFLSFSYKHKYALFSSHNC